MSPARAAAWHALLRVRSGGGRFDDSLAALPRARRPERPRPRARQRAGRRHGQAPRLARRRPRRLHQGAAAPTPTRRCSRRCVWRRSSSSSSTACPPTPWSTTPWRWSRAKASARRASSTRCCARSPSDGRESFATLSDGDGARAWAVRHSCPRVAGQAAAPRARRRGRGALPRRRRRGPRALPAREHAQGRRAGGAHGAGRRRLRDHGRARPARGARLRWAARSSAPRRSATAS